ncbi:Putative peptidoglycan lipid II flippase MurJ [Caenispirillum salinarum AK4]|uniref:Probable lipid II flippase MurJ n=1 Tax=Caenispirillum salinarum AK4 TaxID=1238182 RepID=K9HJ08_9PROT|nr:murein biosynthesis integral membrane protein MurJ [Caenispirillum salinarum]EKV30368.1 Putative peptidoglycan lipid II flippase MurJ [Caenispirillum salinarum AK4]
MSLFRAVATVGGFTLLSRITGFARDILIAGFLGAGTVADTFFVAFKFPNLFRRLFAEGAVAAAFVPLYSQTLEKEGAAEAHLFARRAFTVLGLVLAVFVGLMQLVMPWAIYAFAPGFDAVPGKMELAEDLTRITFPYLLLISLCALLSGVLNSLGRFAAAAATPVLLNLVMMGGLLALHQYTATPGHALAIAVAAAGVIQLLWLIVACRRAGVRIHLVRPTLSPRIKLLARRVVPVAFGAGLYQISLLVDTILASLVSDGAVSYLYYADRINQLPLGVVGTAIGTALLPLLARQIAAGNTEAAHYNQNRAIEASLLFTIPAMSGLIVIAHPIVTALFQRGAFGPLEAAATSGALAAFAVGLPAFVLIKVLSPGFFAREDTKTPVWCAGAGMVVNVVLNLILMQVLGHVGIALATGLAAWVNGGALAVILHRRGHFAPDARLKSRLPRIMGASAVMAGAVWAANRWLVPELPVEGLGAGVPSIVALVALLAVGAGSFTVAAFAMGATSLSDIKGMIRPRRAAQPGE